MTMNLAKQRMKAQRRVNDPPLTGIGQDMLKSFIEGRMVFCVESTDDGSMRWLDELDKDVVLEITSLQAQTPTNSSRLRRMG